MTTENKKTRCPSMVPKIPVYGAVSKTGRIVTCKGDKGSSEQLKATIGVASSEWLAAGEEQVGEPWPEKYLAALKALYAKWGVGNTNRQRLAFWHSYEPNTTITHVETDAEWVKAFELGWVCDQFPADFPSC